MGRISLPFLNKSGNFLFWSSIWDNKHNYTKNLKEDIFIKICIPLIFKSRSSLNYIFSLKKNNLLNNEIIEMDILNFIEINHKNLYNYYSYRSKKIDMYLSKAWVLKYQKWVIIYFFFYSSLFNQFLKIEKKYGVFKYSYNNIFYNYLVNSIKLNSNFNEFSKNIKINSMF
jgi:hypothetical protein